MLFGERDAADPKTTAVRNVHARMGGTLPEGVGRFRPAPVRALTLRVGAEYAKRLLVPALPQRMRLRPARVLGG